MTVLVTGGCGFIGAAVVRALVARGETVAVLDALTYAAEPARLGPARERVALHVADVADAGAVAAVLDSVRPAAVIHAAAETHVDRSIAAAAAFVRTNVLGTQLLLDAARAADVARFVLVSTDEVYGAHEDDTARFAVDAPMAPRSPYAASKAAADLLAQAASRTHGLPLVVVRPCNVYGPWQYPEKLLPVAILRARAGLKVPLYGDGRQRREWLFVEDCAAGIVRALDAAEPGSINHLCSGEERSNREVVGLVLAAMGAPADLIEPVPDRPAHDRRYGLELEPTRTALGWCAQTRLEDGIAATVAWYRENEPWARAKLVTWDRIRG